MISIAICDDEKDICDDLDQQMTEFFAKNSISAEIEVFYSATKLMKTMSDGQTYDLIFLDIEMDGLSGIEFGTLLRDEFDDQTTNIVYISWQDAYALDLFRIRPINFLVKPLRYEMVEDTLATAIKLIGNSDVMFCYQLRNQTHQIPLREIIYFESSNRKIIIHTVNGHVEFYGKLEEIQQQLNSEFFWRIHKSYLVNYNHAEKFSYENVELDNGVKLGISQSLRSEIRSKLEKFSNGGR